jgi:hypothetical protein
VDLSGLRGKAYYLHRQSRLLPLLGHRLADPEPQHDIRRLFPELGHPYSQGISLSVVFGCAILLRQAAEAVRDTARRHLTAGIVRAKGGDGRSAGQLETLLGRVDDLHEGAFSPLSQQPVVRALLLPLVSFGWTTLIENGMLPGL